MTFARCAALLLLLFVAAGAAADYREFSAVPIDPALEIRVRRAADAVLEKYPAQKREDLALVVVDLSDASAPRRADLNGNAPFYPASVVKLSFMIDTFVRRKESVPDVPRALREMIVVSDNDATAYIVDVLSGTAAGPELQGRALRRFVEARRMTNRTFERMGYDLSAMMKPWSFAPYGREMQLIGPNRINRNRATANGTAAAMLWIARRRAVSAEASEAMLALLHRPLAPMRDDENQVDERSPPRRGLRRAPERAEVRARRVHARPGRRRHAAARDRAGAVERAGPVGPRGREVAGSRTASRPRSPSRASRARVLIVAATSA
jgi:hypothetical protein